MANTWNSDKSAILSDHRTFNLISFAEKFHMFKFCFIKMTFPCYDFIAIFTVWKFLIKQKRHSLNQIETGMRGSWTRSNYFKLLWSEKVPLRRRLTNRKTLCFFFRFVHTQYLREHRTTRVICFVKYTKQ